MRLLHDGEAVRAAYEAAYRDSPTATVYQSPEWLDVFRRLSHDLLFVEVGTGAFVPFVCKGKGAFKRAFSLPMGTYGGPVGSGHPDVDFDDLARTLAYPSVRLADFHGTTRGRAEATQSVNTYLIDLTPDYDGIRGRYSKKHREALRQGDRRGVVMKEMDDPALLPTFADLCTGISRKHNNVSVSLEFLRAVFDSMVPKNMAAFYLAWREDRPIGANLVLRSKTITHDWIMGYREESLPLRVVNIMMDAAIRTENELGAQVFDFGATPNDAYGMVRFKLGFGAEPRVYNVYSKLGALYRAGRTLKRQAQQLARSPRASDVEGSER